MSRAKAVIGTILAVAAGFLLLAACDLTTTAPTAGPSQTRNSSAEDLVRQGQEYVKQAEYERAIAAFTEAIRLKPDYQQAYTDRGLAYADRGQFDLAISDLEQASRLSPNDESAFANLGFVYMSKSELEQKAYWDRAIAQFDKAIQIKPDFAVAYGGRGQAYYYMQQYDRALADYDKAIEVDPSFVEAYNGRGFLHQQRRNYDLAIQDYSKAIELAPDYYDAYISLGRVYSESGDLDHALEWFSRAIELDPNHPVGYYDRSRLYQLNLATKESRAKAAADLRKVVELAKGTELGQSAERELKRFEDE